MPVSGLYDGRTEVCLCNTLGLFQSRVCHRHICLFPGSSFCSPRFREMQTTVRLLVKFDNFKLYLHFTLHYSFYKFYLLLLSVGSSTPGPEVCIEMAINIQWFFLCLIPRFSLFIYYPLLVFS